MLAVRVGGWRGRAVSQYANGTFGSSILVGDLSEEASIGESLWWAMEGALLVKISWGSSHQLNGDWELSMDKKPYQYSGFL